MGERLIRRKRDYSRWIMQGRAEERQYLLNTIRLGRHTHSCPKAHMLTVDDECNCDWDIVEPLILRNYQPRVRS